MVLLATLVLPAQGQYHSRGFETAGQTPLHAPLDSFLRRIDTAAAAGGYSYADQRRYPDQRVAQWSPGSLFKRFSGQATNATQPELEELPATEASPPVSTGPRHSIPLVQPTDSAVQVRSNNGLVSLVAREAALSEVLTLLAQSQRLNLVFTTPTTPAAETISVTLDGVEMEEALDAVLSAWGYTWAIHNRIVYVTSAKEGALAAPHVQGRQIMVFELDYASAIDVDQAVKGLLSPVGSSWVAQSSNVDNRRTKEIVTVEDLPRYLRRIEEFVAQVDQPPRQVLIEVHLLEVELDEDQRHGVNFEHLGNISGVDISLRTSGLANPATPQAFFLQTSGANLSGLLEALKSTTDVKTLASPRIHAVNGQESRIQIGEQLGFAVTTTTETSTLESVEFLDVGVVVSVTPRITKDGHVLMRIKPEVSTGRVNPDTGYPEEETTEVETDVLLANGQCMVIGGLIQETDSVISSNVLGLGELKYLGPLFQRRQEVKNRSEIIVALVPHILPLPCDRFERNQCECHRVQEPLFVGALHRNPRPYEPRLRDSIRDPRRWEYAPPHRFHQHYDRIHRLPPVVAEYPQIVSEPVPTQVHPMPQQPLHQQHVEQHHFHHGQPIEPSHGLPPSMHNQPTLVPLEETHASPY